MRKGRGSTADIDLPGCPHRHVPGGHTGGTGDAVQRDIGAGRDRSIVRPAQGGPDLEHRRNRQGFAAIAGVVYRPRYGCQKMCPRAADRRGGKRLCCSVNGTGIIASPANTQAPVIDQIQLTGHRRRIGRYVLALRPVHPQLIMPIPDGAGKTAAGCHSSHPFLPSAF